jgi:hypothetical protein
VAFSIPPSTSSAGVFVDGLAASKLTFEHHLNHQPVICAIAGVKAGQTRTARLVA